MQSDSVSESLTYVSAEPDIKSLRYAYDQSVVELEAYFDLCRESYDERRNWWPGKSRDLRKHGADAFPWEGDHGRGTMENDALGKVPLRAPGGRT